VTALILLQASEPPPLPSGYGWALLQMAVTLLGVCLLAWLILRWARRGGLGVGTRGGRMEVLERLPLDPRRAVHLVRVGDRVLVIGTGEGAPSLLTELDAAEVPEPEPQPKTSFADVLARLRDGGRS
jgi:flagellar protein FliO/FliZ